MHTLTHNMLANQHLWFGSLMARHKCKQSINQQYKRHEKRKDQRVYVQWQVHANEGKAKTNPE